MHSLRGPRNNFFAPEFLNMSKIIQEIVNRKTPHFAIFHLVILHFLKSRGKTVVLGLEFFFINDLKHKIHIINSQRVISPKIGLFQYSK